MCSRGVAFVAVSDKHAWQLIIPSNSLLSLPFPILPPLLLFRPPPLPLSLSLSPFFLSLSSFSLLFSLSWQLKQEKLKTNSNLLLIFVIRLDLGLVLYWIISFIHQVFSCHDCEFPIFFSICVS